MTKLTIIGAGSSYTPELVSGLLKDARIEHLVLFDTEYPRAKRVAEFCQRMASAAGASLGIRHAESLREALDGADFVVTQFRVGGQQARHDDIRMCLEAGVIGQETTGAGGFAKALRTIPVIDEIAQQVTEICPNAWLINFTNPSGLVTEALGSHPGLRSLGLCNVPIESQMFFADFFDVDPDDVEMDWIGLNHLGWLRGVTTADAEQRSERIDELIDAIEEGRLDTEPLIDYVYPSGFLRDIRAIPSSYMRFYYSPLEIFEQLRNAPKTRAEEVMAIDEKLVAYYGDSTTTALPQLLQERGGAWYSRLAVNVIRALMDESPTTHIVNVPCEDKVEGLAPTSVAEIPCTISARGVQPLDCAPPNPWMRGLMVQVKAYEELAIQTARNPTPKGALETLLANPLVPTISQARAIVQSMQDRNLI